MSTLTIRIHQDPDGTWHASAAHDTWTERTTGWCRAVAVYKLRRRVRQRRRLDLL